MKSIMRTVLLVFVAGAMGYFAWERIGHTAVAGAPDPGAQPGFAQPGIALAQGVIVTYFTTDVRCKACRELERLTRLAVTERFPDELDRGEVHFETHNLDRPENRHFARDYQLAFKTVVISDYRDGHEVRWEKMDDVWQLLERPEDFKAYLATQVRDYLGS